MKRKFLEDLGLEDEVVNKIMAENGKDITDLKAKLDDLNEQLNVKDATIKTKSDEISKLKEVDIEALKKEQFDLGKEEGSKEIKVFKQKNAIENALKGYKAKDTSILSKMLDMEKVKFNENFEIVEGLEEQINPLKESHDYLFESDKPLPIFTTGIQQPKSNEITKEAFNKMPYKERIALKSEKPEIYEKLKNE